MQIKKTELILNQKYKHGPSDMVALLPVLTLVYIGQDLVVVQDSCGHDKSLPIDFFLQYAQKV